MPAFCGRPSYHGPGRRAPEAAAWRRATEPSCGSSRAASSATSGRGQRWSGRRVRGRPPYAPTIGRPGAVKRRSPGGGQAADGVFFHFWCGVWRRAQCSVGLAKCVCCVLLRYLLLGSILLGSAPTVRRAVPLPGAPCEEAAAGPDGPARGPCTGGGWPVRSWSDVQQPPLAMPSALNELQTAQVRRGDSARVRPTTVSRRDCVYGTRGAHRSKTLSLKRPCPIVSDARGFANEIAR